MVKMEPAELPQVRGDLRRLSFSHVKLPNKYCEDSQRRRVHAKAAQRNI